MDRPETSERLSEAETLLGPLGLMANLISGALLYSCLIVGYCTVLQY